MSARRDFAALRWRIIRNGPNDERWFSLVAGLVAASGIIIVAGLSRNGTLDPSWLTVALTVFGLTWFVGPILVPAASPMLDPQWFRMLPQRPRKVAAAMAASEATGVGSVITLVALISLIVMAAPYGIVAVTVGIIAVIAQLFFLLWLGRCAQVVVHRLLRSFFGVWLAAFQMSALLAVAFAGWVPLMAVILPDLGEGATNIVVPGANAALSPEMESTLLKLPTGWGLAAVMAASPFESILAVFAPLVGLMAGGSLLRAVWITLTARTLREPPARAQSNVRARPNRAATTVRGGSPVSAVTMRELKTWARDPHRQLGLGHAWMTPVLMILLVAPTNWDWALPFIGVMAAILGAMVAVNTYSLDGTALWQLITTPGALRADIRGRQIAWLLLIGGPIIAGTALLCLISQSPFWAVALGMTLAATGAACAAAPLLSVIMPAPGADARERVSASYSSGNSAGAEWSVFAIVAAISAGAVIAVRTLIAPVIAGLFGRSDFGATVVLPVAHLVTGMVFGAAALILLSTVLQRRLQRMAPALLATFSSKDITRLRSQEQLS